MRVPIQLWNTKPATKNPAKPVSNPKPDLLQPLDFLFLIAPPAIESIKISDISMKLPDFAPLPAPEI